MILGINEWRTLRTLPCCEIITKSQNKKNMINKDKKPSARKLRHGALASWLKMFKS